MIVTSKVGAQTEVDMAVMLLDRTPVLDHVSDELRRAVILEGESIGAFIRPQSVWITIEEKTFTYLLHAIWAPDPAFGCEFRGGPSDGLLLAAPVAPWETSRRPPEYHEALIDDPVGMLITTDPYPPIGPAAIPRLARYRLAGIDSVWDRWVYEFEGAS